MWVVIEHQLEAPLGIDTLEPLKEMVKHNREKWPSQNFRLLRSESVGTNKAWVVAEFKSMTECEQFTKDFWADKWWADFWERTVQKAKGPSGLRAWNYRNIYFDEVPVE